MTSRKCRAEGSLPEARLELVAVAGWDIEGDSSCTSQTKPGPNMPEAVESMVSRRAEREPKEVCR